MYSFLFLAIPAVLVWYLFRHCEYSFKSALPTLLTGFLTGIIICCVKEFLIFSNQYTSAVFAEYMFKHYLNEIVIPYAVCMAVFFLISKDSAEYKIKMLFTLMAAAYISIIPFNVITSGNKHSPFLLFAKPLAITAAVSWISIIAETKFLNIKGKKTIINAIVLILPLSIIPSALEALWYYKISALLTIILSTVFFISAIIGFFSLLKSQNRLNDK